MRFNPIFAGLLAVILAVNWAGCHEARTSTRQATSLLGQPLYPMPMTPEQRAERMDELEVAFAAHQRDPVWEDNIIWLGRRQAYIGRYDLAIMTYTHGLKQLPDSYKIRRHRGHRYITTRRFALAIADLELAAELSRGVTDEMEPDGQPNALGIPTSSNQTNIYYHLGLARYLTGDYEGAADAYRSCLEHSNNDDMKVATLYWLLLTNLRIDPAGSTDEILDAVTADMEIIENTSYHRLLLLFKGEYEPQDLLGDGGTNIDDATVAYGVANWYALNDRHDKAIELLRRVVAGPAWPAFGHIAAEADLADPTR